MQTEPVLSLEPAWSTYQTRLSLNLPMHENLSQGMHPLNQILAHV